MRTIQEVGIEILNDSPKRLYIFLGKEYALKEKYIEFVDRHYQGNHREVDTYKDLQSIARGTSLFPLKPSTYVVRYDNAFIKHLSDGSSLEMEFAHLNLDGTIIFIYEQDSDAKKLDKYLSEYTVTFFPVSVGLQKKYLLNDYPNLPDTVVDNVVQLGQGYTISDRICKSLSYCEDFSALSLQNMRSSFLLQYNNVISNLQIFFADKNFRGIYKILENTSIDISNILYKFLSVIIELMKVRKSSYIDSPYKKYATKWTNQDLHFMFDNIFNELIKLRTKTSDTYNSIMYIATLLCFKEIPRIV